MKQWCRIGPFPYFWRAFLKGLAVLLAVGGCSSGPRTVDIKGEADVILNRDEKGSPLSVVVHVYQLKDAGEFSKLTFDTLASGRPLSDMLGNDLLEKNEVMLVPGGKFEGIGSVRHEAKYLGIVGFFRRPDLHYWRLLVDASEVRSKGLRFRVKDCYLTLDAPKPTLIPGQPAVPAPTCGTDGARSHLSGTKDVTPVGPGQAGKRGAVLEPTRNPASGAARKP